MAGCSLSTAAADAAAGEQFIQLMAMKQNRTEKDKHRAGRSRKELDCAVRVCADMSVSKSSALVTRNWKIAVFNRRKKPACLAIRAPGKSLNVYFFFNKRKSLGDIHQSATTRI